ncbi:MAG TPA: NUDIX domain-containing protein [Candidatus Paceibacterota bacterium]|nr:NUDIX domain-containing protein [Candidatus Paceibacterota bacterium]
MSPERATLLGELLKELAQDPTGFIPDEAWEGAQKAFALPYIELCVVRLYEGKVQILLTHRIDKYWSGWHIPGGMWRTRHTLEQGIAHLSRLELGPEPSLTLLAKGEWEKWLDHPYDVPISHIAICTARDVVETDKMQWFDGVPKGMIADHGHHARFINNVLKQAASLV